jgi:hypothetical protein
MDDIKKAVIVDMMNEGNSTLLKPSVLGKREW